MSEPIHVTANLLPPGKYYGPLTEAEYKQSKATGRVFIVTRNYPKVYQEWYIEAEPEQK